MAADNEHRNDNINDTADMDVTYNEDYSGDVVEPVEFDEQDNNIDNIEGTPEEAPENTEKTENENIPENSENTPDETRGDSEKKDTNETPEKGGDKKPEPGKRDDNAPVPTDGAGDSGEKKKTEDLKPVPREPEKRRILQPPVDGVTIDISGNSCFLNIRRKISAKELRLVKEWMEQHKDELLLENRYNVNSVSISVRNGKVAIDNAFVNALKDISNFDYFEYNTGSIEVAENQSRDILPELFKDASQIHTWGSTEALEEMKSGVLVKHLSGVYGKVFTFGTQGSKFNAEKKTLTNRVTEIGGLSGIESINVIQTGSGATVAKENAFSNNLVDLDEERRDESLSHARDMHILTTSYEYSADYGKAFKNLFDFKAGDFAEYVKEIESKTIEELKDSENVILRWKKANEKALGTYARSAGYTKSVKDEKGRMTVEADIESLMYDIAKDFSRNTILDVDKLLDKDVIAKAYEIDEKGPKAEEQIKAKIEELKKDFEDDTKLALSIAKKRDLHRLIEIAEIYAREKEIYERTKAEEALREEAKKKKDEPEPSSETAAEHKAKEAPDTDELSTHKPEDGTPTDEDIKTGDEKKPENEKTDGKDDDEASEKVPDDGTHVDAETNDKAEEPEVEIETLNTAPNDATKDEEKKDGPVDEEKEDENNKKITISSKIKGDRLDALVNFRKLEWIQSFNRLSSGLYKETRTYRDGRKEVFDNVSRYSDKENFLASEERDIAFKIKTITGNFKARQNIEAAIKAARESLFEKNEELDKATKQLNELKDDPLNKDKVDELNEKIKYLNKDIEKISAHQTFLEKTEIDFKGVASMQAGSVSFEMFRAFCTAERMGDTTLGGTFVNRGNFSAKGAALAGKDWKIVNDPIRTDNMLLHMAGKIEAECTKLYIDFSSMVSKNELAGKLVKPDEFNKTSEAFSAAAVSFENFKKKHDEVLQNKKALESAWDNAFRESVENMGGNIDTTFTYQDTSENPEFREAYDKYRNSMSELMELSNSTAHDLSLALKDLGNNLKEEDKKAVLDNLCGDDGYVSIFYDEKKINEDGKEEIQKIEGYLPMSMSQRVSLFDSMIRNPEQTLCVGQGTSHDFGAYAETRGIKNFVEYTDEAYIEEFTRGQTDAKETKMQIRQYLDNLLTQITDGKLTNSENMKLDEFKEEINKRCAHMTGVENLLGIVEQKYTEYDKATAWDKLYPTFDDYVALQCEKGITLKAEWDKKREEETKVNANPDATADEKRDAKIKTEAAKQDYEDFKLSRKTRLSTHMFQNSDNEKVSADFCYYENEKEIFRNDRKTDPLQLTSRNGDLTEITGEDKEIKAFAGREYWAARWSLMKAGIRQGVSTFIESFRNMSVTEAVLQIILANILLAHKLVSVAKKGVLYAYNSSRIKTLAGKRAVLGLFIEGDFEKERDEKGKVIGLRIKEEALERVATAGVTLYNDKTSGEQRFRVDLNKATGGKRSGKADFSIRMVKELKNAEHARAIESKLAGKQERSEEYVRKIDNKIAKKETAVINEIERRQTEATSDAKIEHSNKKKRIKLREGKGFKK